ncbi:three finger toxin protein, partial [Naja naja]
GYTIKCYNHLSGTPETIEICPDSQYFCYKSSWIDGEMEIEKGCVASCPEFRSSYKSLLCCRKDKCNQ